MTTFVTDHFLELGDIWDISIFLKSINILLILQTICCHFSMPRWYLLDIINGYAMVPYDVVLCSTNVL